MLQLKNISKSYTSGGESILALKNINLTIEAGSIYGIIGLSGAGKSTLIRCLSLLETPSAGEIYLQNINLTAADTKELIKVRRKIGMVFQHFNLLQSRTVFKNIAFPLEITNTPPAQITEKVESLLELTGLSRFKNSYPWQLSGGQQQRVAIARALANDPEVLLCDEATSSLDPKTTKAILKLLKQVNEQLGITIVIITHEMEVIKSICKNVAVLSHGEIVESGKVVDIFGAPQIEITKELVQSCMHLELPNSIKSQLHPQSESNTYPLLQVTFTGEVAKQPLISALTKKFNLEVNILRASLENIDEELMGVMVLTIKGETHEVQTGIDFLKLNKLNVEILGYTPK